ncbi:MAG: GNAT family N-acetyltransferase [Deltaproteobacteria bacterium]|nr:GNAT family N-acetyltransferase [Deltaproteobacteria bacterium]
MNYYDAQNFKLATSQQLAIRQPDINRDVERYHRFVCELPGFRQNYLKHHSTDAGECKRQLESYTGTESWALMAELDGSIVATGTLERQPFEWTRHVAELRCTVAPTSNHLGIGRLMIHQLVALAARQGIERVYVEVLREHRGAQLKLREEGFSTEAVRANYVRDVDGKLHDVLIMSMDIQDIWQNYEDLMYEMDCRFSSGM